MWNRKVCIRIIELILCIACVVALRVTDDESRRVFHYLRNRSRERWALLNNVTWGTIGAALATATCGGYTIITAGLLIAAASGELKGQKMEKFLLGLGIILFGIVGTLSLFSVDNVPDDLVDNAIIFGSLCVITAIVFVIDFLMNPVIAKKKHDGTQTISSKEQAPKQYVTTTTMTVNEKEPPSTGRNITTTWRSPTPEMTEKRNSMNDSALEEDDEREHRLERAERQMREYAQNIENGRGARSGKQARERDESPRKMNGYYRHDDVYQRPLDEVDDAPPFPTLSGEVFPKVVNPGVKIMRVERDDDRGYDNYRLSDTSQYDNVPTRMRGSASSPGILKRQRDAFFADQRRSRDYRPTADEPPRQRISSSSSRPRGPSSNRDEIEMLEEYFDGLRTATGGSTRRASAATQTIDVSGSATRKPTTGGTTISTASTATPASPNDPGYVRHTASNWPHSLKPATPP